MVLPRGEVHEGDRIEMSRHVVRRVTSFRGTRSACVHVSELPLANRAPLFGAEPVLPGLGSTTGLRRILGEESAE